MCAGFCPHFREWERMNNSEPTGLWRSIYLQC